MLPTTPRLSLNTSIVIPDSRAGSTPSGGVSAGTPNGVKMIYGREKQLIFLPDELQEFLNRGGTVRALCTVAHEIQTYDFSIVIIAAFINLFSRVGQSTSRNT